MVKYLLGFLLFFHLSVALGQTRPPFLKDTLPNGGDTSHLNGLHDDILDNIPVVTLDESDMGDASSQNVSGLLTAGRDPFINAAIFNFSAVRYKIRGYDADMSTTFMNGIPIENIENGFTPFGLWGGLNHMMRNRDMTLGLRPTTFAFGDLALTANFDSRASKQRKQTEVGYAISNRNYTNRILFGHNTGLNKNGWAFSFGGTRRWAEQGYVPGTYYDSWSGFISIDKRVKQNHLFSFTAFAAPTESGRQGAAIREVQELTGSNFYNPYWGFQNGKVRNAYISKTNLPVTLVSHEFRLNNHTTLKSGFSYSWGERSSGGLDWYNAADPRPDYYRYLPSYERDPLLKAQIQQAWQTNPSISQINWRQLYESNSNVETINGFTGKRAHYLIGENVTGTRRFALNSVFNTRVTDRLELTGGISYQRLRNNYFRRISDLLGADYHVDFNQFAERSYPNNSLVNQNDLNRPNRILKNGDRYQYDYNIDLSRSAGWLQSILHLSHFDLFAAVELSHTMFFRTGNVRSGLFPDNSFGRSGKYSFLNPSLKAGATYKINGRNYVYINAAFVSRAPFFDNVYLSPRTRDLTQNQVKQETIQTFETGYILNAPKIKFRVNGYLTRINNQMNVMSFYHDVYQNFVNYAVRNIDKLHFGTELGFELKLIPNVTVTGAASIGRFYYQNRQFTTTTLDNTSEVLSEDTIYSRNYRVGGTPQEAFNLGLSYRSPKFWFVSLNANYFSQMWLDFNPIRRTEQAIDGVAKNSDLWNAILNQQRLSSQLTVDFFGGYSWKLPKTFGMKKNMFLALNVGVNNLLNNKSIVTGGFEQLRFDFNDKNINEFPAKYYFAYGINYFINTTLRF